MSDAGFGFCQEAFEQLMNILSLLDNLSEFLGVEVSNIIFFAIGRVWGIRSTTFTRRKKAVI